MLLALGFTLLSWSLHGMEQHKIPWYTLDYLKLELSQITSLTKEEQTAALDKLLQFDPEPFGNLRAYELVPNQYEAYSDIETESITPQVNYKALLTGRAHNTLKSMPIFAINDTVEKFSLNTDQTIPYNHYVIIYRMCWPQKTISPYFLFARIDMSKRGREACHQFLCKALLNMYDKSFSLEQLKDDVLDIRFDRKNHQLKIICEKNIEIIKL